MECPLCEKGELVRSNINYTYQDWNFGDFEADVCNLCKEAFFTEESMITIEKKAKEIGVWGIERKTKIARSGNSLIVRVPKKIAKFLQLNEGDEVIIRPDGKKRFSVLVE